MMSAQYKENRQVRAIVDYFNGIPVAQIAKDFGVSRSTIYTWLRKHKANGLMKTVPSQKEVIRVCFQKDI